MVDPLDATLAAYEDEAERYVSQSNGPSGPMLALLDQIAGLVASEPVLEIGSGPGWDADYLESKGVNVRRTDAVAAFVTKQRRAGHEAHQLDVRSAELGGPYAAIVANAVLLHLSRADFAVVLGRLRDALAATGHLAFTVKEGEGEAWVTDKLIRPRYFVYWSEEAVREVLSGCGLTVTHFERFRGRRDSWLAFIVSA